MRANRDRTLQEYFSEPLYGEALRSRRKRRRRKKKTKGPNGK